MTQPRIKRSTTFENSLKIQTIQVTYFEKKILTDVVSNQKKKTLGMQKALLKCLVLAFDVLARIL